SSRLALVSTMRLSLRAPGTRPELSPTSGRGSGYFTIGAPGTRQPGPEAPGGRPFYPLEKEVKGPHPGTPVPVSITRVRETDFPFGGKTIAKEERFPGSPPGQVGPSRVRRPAGQCPWSAWQGFCVFVVISGQNVSHPSHHQEGVWRTPRTKLGVLHPEPCPK